MSWSDAQFQKRRFFLSLVVPILMGTLMLMALLVDQYILPINATLGVHPRDLHFWYTVVTHVFVHGSWPHLYHNEVAFVLLSTALFYFYPQLAGKVFLGLWCSTGLILWFIGRESIHVGASGLIYALAFFLFFSGLFRKYPPLIAISLIVVFLYGSMVWQMFPWKATEALSWEGHLSGAISGLAFAIFLRKQGPQKPLPPDEDDNEAEEDPYWLVEDKES